MQAIININSDKNSQGAKNGLIQPIHMLIEPNPYTEPNQTHIVPKIGSGHIPT